jgi:hypothetical protein
MLLFCLARLTAFLYSLFIPLIIDWLPDLQEALFNDSIGCLAPGIHSYLTLKVGRLGHLLRSQTYLLHE